MQSWFDAYGESHRNATNKLIHWICVPAIFISLLGLLASIPPVRIPVVGADPWARIVVLLGLVFYLRISIPMFVGMALWSVFCLWLVHYVEINVAWPLWAISLSVFVIAWIGQFIGHKIEGQKPSFFEDLQFLMIGPAWLIGFIYRKLGIAY